MAGRCHLGMINCSSNGVKSDGKGWKRRFIPPETPFEVSHAGNLTHVFFGAFWIFLGSRFSDKLHLASHILWKAIMCWELRGMHHLYHFQTQPYSGYRGAKGPTKAWSFYVRFSEVLNILMHPFWGILSGSRIWSHTRLTPIDGSFLLACNYGSTKLDDGFPFGIKNR